VTRSPKSNQDIIILSVDKGFTTVVMNTSDYRKKMKTFLLDKTYIRLNKDPTNTIAQKTKKKVILIKGQALLSSKIKSTLKLTNHLPS